MEKQNTVVTDIIGLNLQWSYTGDSKKGQESDDYDEESE